MNEQLYLIEATYNEKSHTFEIQNYDQCKANCENFISATTMLLPETIENDEQKKLVKQARTLINKKLKEIKDGRISVNELVLGDFNEQVKSMEYMLDTTSKQLTQKLNDYTPKEKDKKWTISGSSKDLKYLEEIKQFAFELFGIKLEIK